MYYGNIIRLQENGNAIFCKGVLVHGENCGKTVQIQVKTNNAMPFLCFGMPFSHKEFSSRNQRKSSAIVIASNE